MLRRNISKKRILQKSSMQRKKIMLSLGIMIFFIIIFILLFYRNNGQVVQQKDVNYRENSANTHTNYVKIERKTDDEFISKFKNEMKTREMKVENVIEVPYLNQRSGYPTGCEVTSATMLLNFYGYDYTIDEVIDEFLPTSGVEFDEEKDVMIADSPYNSFIGDPSYSGSYGCFAPVIAKTLSDAMDDEQKVVDISGMELEKISELFLSNDIPVLVWVTIGMVPSYPSDEWELLDGSGTFTWIAEEHCMVLVGYDEENFYFNDPLNYDYPVTYEKELAQERFEELEKQAVVIIPKEYNKEVGMSFSTSLQI